MGFAPSSPYVAAGTVAGAIDMSFSTSSVLEIYSLDFSSKGSQLALEGSITAPERFHRIAWGAEPVSGSPLTSGIIAGGLADGSVCLWDPLAVLSGGQGRPAVLARMQKHTGAVRGLEFNKFSPHLLASGAADSDLCIWDISNPSEPSLYPDLQDGAARGGEITFVAWNRIVSHILASTNANGSTVVWDLKRQKPVISFRDPNSQRRCSVLQWNPAFATQLIVASDDDRSPTLQMWDLRNSVSPLKELVGHSKGVLGMSWCPHDSSLLLSSGKDNRTICWEVTAADSLCELPPGSNWNFDVQWCPTIPGVFSTASFDGKINFYSLNACTVPAMVESLNADFTVSRAPAGDSVPLKKAPAWMKRPCGATFGFGGKLVSFTNPDHAAAEAGAPKKSSVSIIRLSQVVTETDLIERSDAFGKAISSKDTNTLRDFCGIKAASGSAGQEEAETWQFLSVLFEDDARRQLLAKLGFSEALLAQGSGASLAAVAETLASAADKLSMADGITKPSIQVPGEDLTAQDDPNFFDNLPEQRPPPPPVPVAPGTEEADKEEPIAIPDVNNEHEEEIQRALFVGNYEAAVEGCLRAARMADALLIANIGGADLYKRTMQRYMQRNPKPYMQVVSAMVDGDYLSLIKTRPVATWKETLAVLATYTGPEQWSVLCDALASRLAHAGMQHAASLCYICAGNVDNAVAYWSRECAAAATSVDVLQNVIEKSMVMGMARNNKKASPSLSELVTSYASILAAQGKMDMALEYLDMVPGEASSVVAILKDRVYRSGASSLAAQPPPFPFIREEVHASAAPAAPVQPQGQSGNGYYEYYKQQEHAGYQQAGAAAAAVAQPPAAQPHQPTHSDMYGHPQGGYGAAATAVPAYSTMAQPYQQAPVQPSAYAAPVAAAGGYGGGYGQAANPYGAPPQVESTPVYTVSKAAVAPPAQPQHVVPPFQTPVASAVAPGGFPPAMPAAPGQPPVAKTDTVPPPSFFNPVSAPAPAPIPVPMQPAQGAVPPGPGLASQSGPAGRMVAPPPLGGVGAPPPQQQQQQQAMPPSVSGPTGPPPNITVQTADTSKVPADQQAIVASFTNLFNACASIANNPAKKKEMDDSGKRIGQLFWRLNEGQVAANVIVKLHELCQALERGDWATAGQRQVELTTTNWDDCGSWLTAVKRLIKARSTM